MNLIFTCSACGVAGVTFGTTSSKTSYTMQMSETIRYTRIGVQIKAIVDVIQAIQPVARGQNVARGDI
jgi:hypothetical protein